MALRILLMETPLSGADTARELCPPGFDLAIERLGTPEFDAALAGTDYIIGYGDPAQNDAFFARAPKLKLIQLLSAGYDRCDIEAARRAKVAICNNGGANSTAVAEHALLLMLAVCRRLTWQHQNVVAGRWRGNDPGGAKLYELRGKKLGIVGLGAIGKKVARLANAFGMDIQYYDIRRLSEDAEDALDVRFRLLGELLRDSDILSLHVPLTPATKHLINAEALRKMPNHAYLINTCRGPVVEETALYEALRDGVIAGAGLDVLDQEPPPADNPLFTLPNVILTPHFAGPTWDNQVARARNAFDNCQRMARGEAPLWVIPELIT
jgi:phosphoglycerate dehydrogenase-like enzyme